jgi:hypothetical protein
MSLWTIRKGRKKEKEHTKKRKRAFKKEERWYPNNRAQPPRSGDCG